MMLRIDRLKSKGNLILSQSVKCMHTLRKSKRTGQVHHVWQKIRYLVLKETKIKAYAL